jgi:O-antigen/teichoic acid export membrane protein
MIIRPAFLSITLLAAYLLWRGGLLHQPLTAPIAMAFTVVATAVGFSVGTWLLSRKMPAAARTAMPIERKIAWKTSALPLMFLASMNVLFGHADTLILGWIKGVEAVGLYSVADKAADLAVVFLTVQSTAFASTAASLYAVGDLEAVQRLVTRLARLSFAACLPLAAVLIFGGHWFLLALYGPQFVPARTALTILTLGRLFDVSMGSQAMLLTMTGNERDCARAMAVAVVANVSLNVLLVPVLGSTGAALGNVISLVFWNVWLAVALLRKTGIHCTIIGPLSRRR